MPSNTLNTRIQLKYDTQTAWEAVQDTFQPLSGELCIYKMTDGSLKFKVGDGTSYLNQLEFVNGDLETIISELQAEMGTISGTVDDINSTVGTLNNSVSGLNSTVLGLQSSKANVNSPVFTGSPQSVTPDSSDNSTKIATTAYVQNVIAGIGGGSSFKCVLSQTQPIAGTLSEGDLWLKII